MSLSKGVACCDKVTSGYGYVAAAAFGSVLVNQCLAIRVMKARKQYDVKYPRMYHSEPDHVFNCIQRAHQNFLEGQSVYLVCLVIAGSKFPRAAAACGGVYLLGRLVYSYGYSTGKPENRLKGAAVQMLGLLPMFGMSIFSILCQTGILHKEGGNCCTGCC